MSTLHIQRDERREAARATGSSLPGPPSPATILRSFIELTGQLIAAHTHLINSYLRIGSTLVRGTRPATPTASIRHPRTEEGPAAAREHRDPSPTAPTDLIAARAYQIFVQRGGEPGNPVDDWRQAEAELRGETTG